MPLLIAVLLAAVIATFLWVAYGRVEATLIRTAGNRAQVAADQTAALVDARRSVDQVSQLASAPELQRLLKTRTAEAREAARVRLASSATSSPRRIEIWDNAGTLVLEIAVPLGAAGQAAANNLPVGSPPSYVGAGRLEGSNDVVFFDIVAEIRADSSAPQADTGRLGYLRTRTTFVESPKGIFARLVGRDAAVRIANRDGETWTDLSRVMAAGTADFTRDGVATLRDSDGRMRLGAVALVPGAPWAVWVGFPLADVIAPAQLFLSDMVVVALAFVSVAAFLGAVLSARVTKPLIQINNAAAAVSSGDYSRRVDVKRSDEIGQLARTFNTMAAEIGAAADALKKSEQSFRQLFSNNPNPMWVYDESTLRFVDVNDMAVTHYGYSRDEFLDMTIKDIRPSDELPALIDNLSQLAPAAERAGVWKHRKKDGTIIDVEISSHALDLNGQAVRAVLAHDVTAAMTAERALRESEAIFRGMAEAMPHIVWTARPDGDRTYYNQRWYDYTGLAPEQTLGQQWQSMLHPDDREEAVGWWRTALESGRSAAVSYRLRRRDGVYRWHTGRAAPLTNDRGAIAMWVGTVTDIDDVRRDRELLQALNEELEQRVRDRTSELAAANQELEAFSYSVSHDLRAPLRHVQGYVEMLTAATAGQLSDKSLRYLSTITAATLEMGELIDNLLAFSRISRITLTQSVVSLDIVVRDVIAGLEMSTRGRNIKWRIAPLPAAAGDSSLLKQVFANLLGNAVKYTRDRDPAEIEIGCAPSEEGHHVLFVRDNGAGFDMQYAHKLFGVFQRLHRTDEFEGTGIGLATVRRIVTRHGGRTWAEGKINGGATIYVTLPAAEPQG